MRLRAGLCGLLLTILVGCETIPASVKIEIDDRLIELKRKPAPAPAPVPVPASAPAPAPALTPAAPTPAPTVQADEPYATPER
jgi:hypothetical protein